MPIGKNYDSLPKRKWFRIKLVYSFIGTSLRTGNSNPVDPLFLSKVFSIRKPGSVSASKLKKIYTELNRYLHDDKTTHQPANVQFVAKMTLNAMRFYLEHYMCAHTGGPAPTIDPPNVANFPEYASIDFSARVAIDQNALTQDPFPAATPNNNREYDGAAGGDHGGALGD